ncbi:MAG: hypothetical protein TREMPRED_003178 [Tremellales sp. Tagirdzhanova-0007]|nr:MAG: hypothetical protein TREMPRED_003178 [Tremellales sp. Tagirdzhanova-0007]
MSALRLSPARARANANLSTSIRNDRASQTPGRALLAPRQREFRTLSELSYPTVVKRWPVIITSIVSTVTNVNHSLHQSPTPETEAKLVEGKGIISKLSSLKYEMGRNFVLLPIEEDGEGNVTCYNDELAMYTQDEKRWFTMNWLFAEYRRLRNYFAMTQHWRDFDPFFTSKADTYKSSSGAIIHLAKALNGMIEQSDLLKDFEAQGSPLEIAFMEIIQADLWGNATDLSLLVDLKYEDLQKLQAVGAAAQAEQAKLILRNDLGQVWEFMKRLQRGRVDIVLDNAGFELYTDFVFADFLISCTPFVGEVVFHSKSIPWLIEFIIPLVTFTRSHSTSWAIDSLLDREFFASASTLPTPTDTQNLSVLAHRWKSHLASGRFRLSVPLDTTLGNESDSEIGGFWTTQFAYQDLPTAAPNLLNEMKKSDLVVFKGDLNYRKLVGDAKWNPTTSFEEALGPLAGKITLLSLRTNKADTIVGLRQGIEAKLDESNPDWRISGK